VWQELEQGFGQLRTDLLDRAVVVLDGHGRLRKDRARVQLGVHAMPGETELAVAVAERPGHRNRPAVARQLARMVVDGAEASHIERFLRKLPGKSAAQHEVWL
jgi:hypothetical protein